LQENKKKKKAMVANAVALNPKLALQRSEEGDSNNAVTTFFFFFSCCRAAAQRRRRWQRLQSPSFLFLVEALQHSELPWPSSSDFATLQ
jgi:hypothetical protein